MVGKDRTGSARVEDYLSDSNMVEDGGFFQWFGSGSSL